jgi:hypothetical protein
MPNVVIYEIGAVAENGLYRRPSRRHTEGAALNEALQQRWFIVACRVARARAVAGLYWWKVDFHLDPAAADPAADRHDSFVGRPGEDAVRSCFASWGAAG